LLSLIYRPFLNRNVSRQIARGDLMAVRLIVTFTTKTGKGPDFIASFAPVVEEVLKEKGCEQYELFRSEENSERIVLLERWTTAGDLDAHAEAMRARGPSPTAPFRDEDAPPVLERFEV
jgi:quinol monooxygenase YgiN